MQFKKILYLLLLSSMLFFSCSYTQTLQANKPHTDTFYNSFIELHETLLKFSSNQITLDKVEPALVSFDKEINIFLESPAYTTYAGRNEDFYSLGNKLYIDFNEFYYAFLATPYADYKLLIEKVDYDVMQLINYQRSFAIATCNIYLEVLLAFIFLMFLTLYFSLFYGKKYRHTIEELGTSQQNEAASSQMNKEYIIALEKQRANFSREIHDTVIQDLRAIRLHTEVLKVTDETEGNKEKIIDITNQCVSNLRSVCYDLTPPDLTMEFTNSKANGLITSIQNLCDHFTTNSGIPCNLNIAPNIYFGYLTVEENIYIFRIIQEALVNIQKHAQAEYASVLIRNQEKNGKNSLLVFITDDGKGMDPEINNPDKIRYHFGLRNMYSRAELLKGTLSVISEDGDGTVIRLEVPLK